jgi:hypothetical protein
MKKEIIKVAKSVAPLNLSVVNLTDLFVSIQLLLKNRNS